MVRVLNSEGLYGNTFSVPIQSPILLIVNGKQYSASEIDNLPPDLNPKNLATVSRGNITAFFTASSPLSNHRSFSYKLQNQNFSSVELYFMYCKASHFQDEQKARKILDTDNPKTAKALG